MRGINHSTHKANMVKAIMDIRQARAMKREAMAAMKAGDWDKARTLLKMYTNIENRRNGLRKLS